MDEVLRGNNGARILCSDRHFPIVENVWWSAPDTGMVREYFRWLTPQAKRASREGLLLVNFTDAGQAAPPSAEVRRLIAELTTEWTKLVVLPARLASVVVVESTVVRAALRTISWLHGELDVHYANGREEGGQMALEQLRAFGASGPAGFEPKRWPRPPKPP